MKPEPRSSGLVYSTDAGRMCPHCRQPISACACKSAAPAPAPAAGDGTVRVSRQTKGRAGKAVTLVDGLRPAGGDAGLAEIAKRLRSACGAGGTVKGGVIEIQGDHCIRVIDWLRSVGHIVKRAGG